MEQHQPYIIVTVGPTGAGKSALPTLIINDLKLNKSYVNIQIDDIIQSNPNYKSEINKVIKKKFNHNNTHKLTKADNKAVNNNVNNKTKKIKKITNAMNNNKFIAMMNNVYMATRKGNYCDGKPCNAYNDSLLDKAIHESKNIVFETTGNNNINWLFEKLEEHVKPPNKKYIIIISYMLTTYMKLLKRAKQRAISAFNAYMSQKNELQNNPAKSVPVPRIPAFKKHNFAGLIVIIYNNIIPLLKKYKIDNTSISNDKHNNKPNNKSNSRLLYTDANSKLVNYFYVYDNTKDGVGPTLLFKGDNVSILYGNIDNLNTTINSYTQTTNLN
jgi:hypothetical protein